MSHRVRFVYFINFISFVIVLFTEVMWEQRCNKNNGIYNELIHTHTLPCKASDEISQPFENTFFVSYSFQVTVTVLQL